MFDVHWAEAKAVQAAKRSPCQKSKRGVVIWAPGDHTHGPNPFYAFGWNSRADADCDGGQCSKLMLGVGLAAVWLKHEQGWRAYLPEDFHRRTLVNCGLIPG